MHLKIFEKLKKTLKTLSSGKKTQKNPKKPKKPKKKTKKPKKTLWAGFFLKKPGFFPTLVGVLLIASSFLNSTNIQLSPVSNMTRWSSG
jgi:hypothetical protein